MAVGGACLAAALLAKNVEEKSVSISAGVTALCGITEPGVYGVLFPKTYPLVGAMIGGGIGGLLAGLLEKKLIPEEFGNYEPSLTEIFVERAGDQA